MKKVPFLFALAVASLLASAVFAQAPAAPALSKATDFPAPKMDGKTGLPQAGFIAAHERFLAKAKEGTAQLLFLGDSITAGWSGAGKDVWAKAFANYQPVNFGVSGDRTEHVLWRITNG